MKILPKHHYYIPLKNRPNHHYYRPQKIEEISEKKIVRNFLTNLKISIFFEFFSENVLKTLLRGGEITKKNQEIVNSDISSKTPLLQTSKNRRNL